MRHDPVWLMSQPFSLPTGLYQPDPVFSGVQYFSQYKLFPNTASVDSLYEDWGPSRPVAMEIVSFLCAKPLSDMRYFRFR